ncbi:MAG: hypothetical protein KC636_34215, partial [Myxococcales bacterium]|nr:hypothetical protein [Myxococcales bacterium]
PPNGFSRVTRAGDGTWTPVVADTIGDDWHRFTLDADGVPVTFGYADLPPWQLRSLREGVAASLGQPSDTWFPERYLPTRSPAFGLEVVTPRYGAALQYPDSLAVAWPEGDAYTHVELPGTGAPQYTCVVPDGPPCEGLTCQESGVGVEEDQFALARTEDGAFW